jgi:alkyl hydroperoxide reductase subunit AhpC
LNALRQSFDAVDTQVLGISVDSKHSHKAWAESFGGILYPLLADFHPKGAVARQYGLWLEDDGTSDRATILIDKQGKVLWSESVGPGGQRQPSELLERVKSLV